MSAEYMGNLDNAAFENISLTFRFRLKFDDNEDCDEYFENDVHKDHCFLYYWPIAICAKADAVDIANIVVEKQGHYIDRFAEDWASNYIYVAAFRGMPE